MLICSIMRQNVRFITNCLGEAVHVVCGRYFDRKIPPTGWHAWSMTRQVSLTVLPTSCSGTLTDSESQVDIM